MKSHRYSKQASFSTLRAWGWVRAAREAALRLPHGGLNLRSMWSLFSSALAIHFGPDSTIVYARGKGVVVNEPSIVAINKVNGRIEAVGSDAKEMIGRNPDNLVPITPVKDG